MNATPHVRKNCMKFLEGYLEHRGQDNKWRLYWMVLKDQSLYIFKSKETVQDNLIGSLQVNRDTRFILGDSDPKRECFKFDLRTSRHQNKFKARKYSERELWRGYIEALAKGVVSSDLDLMHGQIQMIADEIRIYYCNNKTPGSQRTSSIGSGSIESGFSDPDGSFGSFSSIESETMSTNNGGPFMRHKFWMESYRTETPTWFFANCTRELAEKILLGSPQLGNTLMRESHTYKNNGSYTISKLVAAERSPLSHFEVIRVAAGYKINAENAPETFQCLSDVMKHFVKISGAAATRPFVTNDYKKLGIETPDYTTKIVKVDNDNGEELPEQYEEPLPPVSGPMDGTKTLPNRANFSSFRSSLQSATQVGTRDKILRPALQQVDHSAAMAVNYLPSHPEIPTAQQPRIPVDTNTSVVFKTSRSQSVPAIQFNPLEQNVPMTRPGMVMVKRNQSYRETNQYRPVQEPQSPRSPIQPSEVFDPYRRESVPANMSGQGNAVSPEDPYKGSGSLSSSDPYRQENPYKGRSLPPTPTECHNTQLYQNFPVQKNVESPTESPLNRPRSPTSPRLSVGDSMLLGDIQSQLAKLKPTGKSTTGPLSPEIKSATTVPQSLDIKAILKGPQSPELKSPPPVAPKSKSVGQFARTSGNIAGNVPIGDNASGGSRKDINDNNTSIVEESLATGEEKEKMKKRLEAMFAGSTPITPVPRDQMIPKTKSVPNLPLPPVPVSYNIDEEVYEELLD